MQIQKRKNRLDVMMLGHCKELLNMPSMPAPSGEATRFQDPIQTPSPRYPAGYRSFGGLLSSGNVEKKGVR